LSVPLLIFTGGEIVQNLALFFTPVTFDKLWVQNCNIPGIKAFVGRADDWTVSSSTRSEEYDQPNCSKIMD